jgi:hypothetical protein
MKQKVSNEKWPDNYYDYAFIIDKVTPCSFLN